MLAKTIHVRDSFLHFMFVFLLLRNLYAKNKDITDV